jgi:peptidoglycan/LPS O-acetylase OafA/YrhL
MVRFIPNLESIRGLAALTVCLFHAADIQFMNAPIVDKVSAARVVLNGLGAVVLFFVLSGFVLRLSLANRASDASTSVVSSFVIARLFRLFPVIIATIVVIACISIVILSQHPEVGGVIRNALLLDTTMNGAFWTLQVEVFGSALVLAAFLLERRYGIWPVVAITIGLVPLSFFGSSALIGGINVGLFYTFLCGYLVATVPKIPLRWTRYLILALCIALIVFYVAHTKGFVLKQWWLFITALSATIIVYALSNDYFHNLLQFRPIRWLGKLSYSFYAVHILGLGVEQYTSKLIEPLEPAHWVAALVLLSTAAGVAFLFATPMYYFIERPGISFGRNAIAALLSGSSRTRRSVA